MIHMGPSNCGIYPLYCISLLINLSPPPPDCELCQAKASPWSIFVSCRRSALAGIQEATVPVGNGSMLPTWTFPFSYLQALVEGSNGTLCPWPSSWNLICKFHWFLSFHILRAYVLTLTMVAVPNHQSAQALNPPCPCQSKQCLRTF